jgi:hypothetical protein
MPSKYSIVVLLFSGLIPASAFTLMRISVCMKKGMIGPTVACVFFYSALQYFLSEDILHGVNVRFLPSQMICETSGLAHKHHVEGHNKNTAAVVHPTKKVQYSVLLLIPIVNCMSLIVPLI